MARRPWFPLYVPDYLSKTGHLDGVASGAYLHLLMHQWMHGSIPDDDASLMRITRLTTHLWKKCRCEVLYFFQQGINQRLKEEMEKAEEISAKRAKSAMQMHVQLQSKSTHNHNHSNNNKEEEKKVLTPLDGSKPIRRSSLPQDFPDAEALAWAREYWLKASRGDLVAGVEEHAAEFRDYHAGKGTVAKDWPATWRTWARNAKKFNRQDRGNGKPSSTDKHLAGIADLIEERRNRAVG